MRWTTTLALRGLALLATAATASAHGGPASPECHAAGEPGTNSSYSSLDAGASDQRTGDALVDTDASLSDENSGTFAGT